VFVDRVLTYGVNSQRWLEFTTSVPVAVLLCAATLGIDDPFFLLTHAVLAVAVVVVAYGQQREKLMAAVERDARVAWFPFATATGLFTSQWAIIIANAQEQNMRAKYTLNWAPTACLIAGVCAMAYVMLRSSRYVTSSFPSLFKPALTTANADIAEQIISNVTRACLSAFLFWR
jgi:hypothetical protein